MSDGQTCPKREALFLKSSVKKIVQVSSAIRLSWKFAAPVTQFFLLCLKPVELLFIADVAWVRGQGEYPGGDGWTGERGKGGWGGGADTSLYTSDVDWRIWIHKILWIWIKVYKINKLILKYFWETNQNLNLNHLIRKNIISCKKRFLYVREKECSRSAFSSLCAHF